MYWLIASILSYILLIGTIINTSDAFTCNGIDASDPTVCSSHGFCIFQDICICHTGYRIGNEPNKTETCEGIIPGNRGSIHTYGFGDNTAFQLQNGTFSGVFSSFQYQEVSVDAGEYSLYSVAGYSHSLSSTNQRLFGWGNAAQVGISSPSNIPVATHINATILEGKKIVLIDSFEHTIIVTESNEVYGWGANNFKIDGTGQDYTTPVLMSKGAMGTKKIIAIACGRYISLFLTSDGVLYSQGKNHDNHLLGLPTKSVDDTQATPAEVGLMDGDEVIAFSSGDILTHVISSSRTIYGWGNKHQVGVTTDGVIPTPLGSLPDNEIPRSVHHGSTYTMILTEEGHVFSWGYSFSGGLGLPSPIQTTPARVEGVILNKHIKMLSVRNEFTIALDSLGQLYVWGTLSTLEYSTATQLSTMFEGTDLLDDSRAAKLSSGRGHILVDFYTIPYCFGIRDDDSSVCSQHGDCKGEDTCVCDEGYTGSNCELFICYNHVSNETGIVCSGNGTCVAPDNCTCDAGHTGDNCEFDTCFGLSSQDPDVCTRNGTCVAPDTCSCFTGFLGDECQVIDCFGKFSNGTDACFGSGTCVLPDTCECLPQYFGDECNVTECFSILSNNSAVCSGNGICSSPDTCDCDQGFIGLDCNVTYCAGILSNDSSVCSGQGVCLGPDTCLCDSGYSGETCQFPICFDVLANETTVCSGYGVCTAPDTCNCEDDYYGNTCNVTICNGVLSNDSMVCSGNGDCSSPNNCSCYSGFNGTDCKDFSCYSKSKDDLEVCSGQGSCVGPNNCSCAVGSDGLECEYFVCYGQFGKNVCSTFGECTAPDVCSCNTGHSGSQCEDYSCFDVPHSDSSVCSGKGNCTTHNQCVCEYGFGNLNCEDFVCYGLNSSDPTVCSSHGSCTGPDLCVCEANFQIADDCSLTSCFGQLSNQSSVCTARGVCSDLDTCSCSTGYTGEECQLNLCFDIPSNDSSVCNGNGVCSDYNQCDCTTNYTSANCSLTSCFGVPSINSTVCSGHGYCFKYDVCMCDEEWEGASCSKIVDSPLSPAIVVVPIVIVSIGVLALLLCVCCIIVVVCLLFVGFFTLKRNKKVRIIPVEPLGNLDDMEEIFEDNKSDISYMGIYKKSSNSLDELGEEDFAAADGGLFDSSFIWTRSNKKRIHPAANLSLNAMDETDSEPDISDQVVKNLVTLFKKQAPTLDEQVEITGEFDSVIQSQQGDTEMSEFNPQENSEED